ncbi:hypothetical protein SRHO_G00087430 [Serrasalmus rhombeus]
MTATPHQALSGTREAARCGNKKVLFWSHRRGQVNKPFLLPQAIKRRDKPIDFNTADPVRGAQKSGHMEINRAHDSIDNLPDSCPGPVEETGKRGPLMPCSQLGPTCFPDHKPKLPAALPALPSPVSAGDLSPLAGNKGITPVFLPAICTIQNKWLFWEDQARPGLEVTVESVPAVAE